MPAVAGVGVALDPKGVCIGVGVFELLDAGIDEGCGVVGVAVGNEEG